MDISGVAFTTFQLTGAVYQLWHTYESSKPAGTTQLIWHAFSVLFLEKFVVQTRREELDREFEQLCQEI